MLRFIVVLSKLKWELQFQQRGSKTSVHCKLSARKVTFDSSQRILFVYGS